MSYLDKYPHCNGCPVSKYCGTMIQSTKLCRSYTKTNKTMETVEKTKGQLVARCFFVNGKVAYENYQKYYKGVNKPIKKCLVRNLFDDNTCA